MITSRRLLSSVFVGGLSFFSRFTAGSAGRRFHRSLFRQSEKGRTLSTSKAQEGYYTPGRGRGCFDSFGGSLAAGIKSTTTSSSSSTVRQGISSKAGLATITARQRAREIATLSRFFLNKNSMLRGRSSPLEVAIEIKTTSASCP